jgi:ribonuclease VapC
MFIDASALVAILLSEADKESLQTKLGEAPVRYTTPMSIYETVLGIDRKLQCGLTVARREVSGFLASTQTAVCDITESVGEEALTAFERFGKGRHRAALNMGDCFSYACAKVLKVPLLCKGDDFIHTDIRIA